VDSIAYWKDRLFLNAVVYSLPISLIALIPSFLIAYLQDQMFLCIFNVSTFLAIAGVTLSLQIPLPVKKAFVVVMLTTLAITLIAYLGTFGVGSVYLLALCVFISFLYSDRLAYLSVLVNFVIYTCFACIIYFKLFNAPVIRNVRLSEWISYALNFLFLNLLLVIQVRRILKGLENTIRKEARLLKVLKKELTEKNLRTDRLQESEEHYRSLFWKNPSPMWIFDRTTLYFLQVNEAATHKYGYSPEQFINMRIHQINYTEDKDATTEMLTGTDRTDGFVQNTTRHRKSDGQGFDVEIRCSAISFQGRRAILVIARNITQQMEYIRAIETQNSRLQKIAYIQSHMVRAPLARIMGLSDLIMQDDKEQTDKELLAYLDISVRELDEVIKNIVSEGTYTVLSVDPSEDHRAE
jgi:PAS domain S-box-containing protein